MANLTKSKHLFGFTSPRTLEKIIPEIKLLSDNFTGEPWAGNEETQATFFKTLFDSEFYEGTTYPSDPALAARDRITRAPKSLGFINLDPEISLTDAGYELVSSNRPYEIITKQLLKFQLPSPYHTQSKSLDFSVRPYLELLRLIYDLGSLSKTEIALYFLQLTNIKKYRSIVNKIHQFRKQGKSFKGSRKLFIYQSFEKEIREIFADEISLKKFKTRESSEVSFRKFIKTKRSNMLDYADAFTRYIRATKLVTIQKKTFRLVIVPAKLDEVEYILKNIKRSPVLFKKEKDFKSYLFSSANVSLLSDNESLLIKKLSSLEVSVKEGQYDVNKLKDLLEIRENEILSIKIEETSKALKSYKEFDNVIEVFRQIRKGDIPDPSLILEWNVWRALVMINYAKNVQGNFVVDLDGMPLSNAPGKKPDIEIDYNSFSLIVEVTLSSGERQYDMEGEPVARHYGRAKEEIKKDLFCLFIAPQISRGTLSHYFNLNKMNTKYYGGKTKIIPLTIENFISFLTAARDSKFNNPTKLEVWLDSLWKYNQECEDESVWFEEIQNNVLKWAS